MTYNYKKWNDDSGGGGGGGGSVTGTGTGTSTDSSTQTLSPLTDFFLNICSLPFAVSVQSLQTLIYTSSSPSPSPSC